MDKTTSQTEMPPRDFIGRRIQDILVCIEMELYGLDYAEVLLVLGENAILPFPHDLEDKVAARQPHAGHTSLFSKSHKVYFQDLDTQRTQSQWVDTARLEGETIVDLLYSVHADTVALLLGNGAIITATLVAPNGTGLAGLNCFANLVDFERRYGMDYERLLHS